jgi:hypothetical protein
MKGYAAYEAPHGILTRDCNCEAAKVRCPAPYFGWVDFLTKDMHQAPGGTSLPLNTVHGEIASPVFS